jgi:hypothetical protein
MLARLPISMKQRYGATRKNLCAASNGADTIAAFVTLL